MKCRMSFYFLSTILLTELSFTGCSGLGQPSDDEILKQISAIDDCELQMTMKKGSELAENSRELLAKIQAGVSASPAPEPTYDSHGLRMCYIATVPNETISKKARSLPGLIPMGRSCERLLDTTKNSAVVDYKDCVMQGITAAEAAKH